MPLALWEPLVKQIFPAHPSLPWLAKIDELPKQPKFPQHILAFCSTNLHLELGIVKIVDFGGKVCVCVWGGGTIDEEAGCVFNLWDLGEASGAGRHPHHPWPGLPYFMTTMLTINMKKDTMMMICHQWQCQLLSCVLSRFEMFGMGRARIISTGVWQQHHCCRCKAISNRDSRFQITATIDWLY